jgi:hypothetical protein
VFAIFLRTKGTCNAIGCFHILFFKSTATRKAVWKVRRKEKGSNVMADRIDFSLVRSAVVVTFCIGCLGEEKFDDKSPNVTSSHEFPVLIFTKSHHF